MGRLTTVIAVLVVLVAVAAQAAELRGVVEEVAGLELWIRLEGSMLPKVGDPVEISFSLPDGEELKVGSWAVTDVVGGLVRASVVDHTGRPSRGQHALIHSDEPQPNRASGLSGATTPSGRIAGGDGLDAVAADLLHKLEDPQPKVVQHAAKALFRRYRNLPQVQETADRVLRADFNTAPDDPYLVDAMSYLCNILGRSGEAGYAATLADVARNARSKKLRKYAKANAEKLR